MVKKGEDMQQRSMCLHTRVALVILVLLKHLCYNFFQYVIILIIICCHLCEPTYLLLHSNFLSNHGNLREISKPTNSTATEQNFSLLVCMLSNREGFAHGEQK